MTVTPTVLREYDRSAPDPNETETATFGLGCFWGPDATFGARDGVVRTRVGYAGGSRADPTYRALGDHTEVVQIEFDPEQTSYRDLLEVAFREHDPRRQTAKRQYQNLVLTEGDDQRGAVIEHIEGSDHPRERVETRIEPLDQFYPAEGYHQKYTLRSHAALLEQFETVYDETGIRESPAAAKLNAHVTGKEVSVPFLNARNR
ncbi:peptide methionine sulfoxide reductase [Halovenus sp. WSH3]|uniref:peptide-methionine (S)-S-oxide reductase n=1 Tax=Halovenus carboxidivorans TaxID=2692199 RepID=A0A6B0T5W3_9EURY|nr:peptide-methionine (S)-S-oxide reductase [Halovenus carboxidivorans]MXR50611.1 peptide methionine sulfoxide reductase [Halovenus carboxidivorans]